MRLRVGQVWSDLDILYHLNSLDVCYFVHLCRAEGEADGEFAGAKAEVRLVAQGRQLNFIEQRLMDLEESHATLVDVMKQMRKKKG